MQYTLRAFVEGRDQRLDAICRTFCSMERTAYNLLREGMSAGAVKATLRERYGVKNARWCQSAMNQARAVIASQEEGIGYRIEQFREKTRNMKEKLERLSVDVNHAYSSRVALAKYGKLFGGFNRHQLAAFVIARRALGFGERPAFDCLPGERKERAMWNHCVRYYGYHPRIQTSPRHEPMEWKSGGDGNGGGVITELFTAPPATTSARGSSHTPAIVAGAQVTGASIGRAGRVHPNGHTSRGDGVSPPPSEDGVASLLSSDTEDTVIW
ncbi:MAG: hypothetical protein JRN73_08000 [Nitrososphaerota archaeon]|nr:hypothetical protein [Nitrososphaerota archaeon]